MHVATTRRQHNGKVYESHLLRRSYREDGKVKNETLANLSHLPKETIELIRASEPVKAPETDAQDFFCASFWMVGLLIHATVGSLGGVGRRPQNRRGLAA